MKKMENARKLPKNDKAGLEENIMTEMMKAVGKPLIDSLGIDA